MPRGQANSDEQIEKHSRFAGGLAFVWYIAASITLLQLLTANCYGYFGDELYHIACGEHSGQRVETRKGASNVTVNFGSSFIRILHAG